MIVACPAHAATGLLSPIDPDAATITGAIDYASVSVATFAVPKERFASALDASGVLVPKPEGFVMTATQFLTSKWAHLERPDTEVLRVSAGRDGDTRAASMTDADFVAHCVAELGILLDVDVADLPARVTRWNDAFPQYRPGHIDRMRDLDAAISRHPGLELAGAAYGGLGIPDCVKQGVAAAERVR